MDISKVKYLAELFRKEAMNQLSKKSKFLALLLRHNPGKANLDMDNAGWVNVAQLFENTEITPEELEQIVATDSKGRYSYSDDKTKIRANQGHSVQVDVGLHKLSPDEVPDTLYHGTADRFLHLIQAEGLKPMGRQHVHLSSDTATAVNVGSRHGKPFVLRIPAKQMAQQGHEFYISENGVYLTGPIEPQDVIFE